MILYLTIPLIILLFRKEINKKNYTIQDYIVILLLGLICGLRYNVGTDYALYTRMYNHINWFPRVEVAFKKIIETFNMFDFPASVFFFFFSFLTIIIIYISIKKRTKYPAETLFLFITMGFYALQFNIIRQMLAVAIVLYSIKYIQEKKIIKYILCILVAYLCHSTAIIMIPFYFISNIKFTKMQMIFLLLIMFGLSFMYEPLLNFVTTHSELYSVYSITNNYTYIKGGIGTYTILFFNLLVMHITIKNKDSLIEYESNNLQYINLALFSFFFYFLSLSNSVMVRPAYYLFICMIYILPDLYRVHKNMFKSKNSLLIYVFFILYYIINLISFNTMLPYKWIFF